jgi:hypothetical protein
MCFFAFNGAINDNGCLRLGWCLAAAIYPPANFTIDWEKTEYL